MEQEQRLISIIREIVANETGNSSKIEYEIGEILGTSGTSNEMVEVRMRIDEYDTKEEVELSAGMNVSEGDFVVVATPESGQAYIHRVLQGFRDDTFSKMVINFNEGWIGVNGDGVSPASFGILGQVLTSGGPTASAYWGVGGGAGGYSDHDSLTGVSPDDHHVKYTDAEAVAATSSYYEASGQKLDDHAAPDDNTDNDATTSAHGLLPKLDGITINFLRGDGAWAADSYKHIQGSPDTTWTVNHNLGRYPAVTALDSGGTEFECQIDHNTINQVVLTLASAISGTATCS